MREVDDDASGFIDYIEFLKMFHTVSTDLDEEELTELFNEIDTDGEGSLDRDEVTALLVKLSMPVDKAAVNEVMAEMDPDGDEAVTLAEFLKWWGSVCAEVKNKMSMLATPLPEVVETVEDLLDEVEAIHELELARLEVERHIHTVNTIAAMWRRKQARTLVNEMKRAALVTIGHIEAEKRYQALSTTIIRQGMEADSKNIGKLIKGRVIVATQTATQLDGSTRVEFTRPGTLMVGWVSVAAKSGKVLLKLLPQIIPEKDPEPEPEPALPYETPWVGRAPDALLPPDRLDERLAAMDKFEERWMKRAANEETAVVKTVNMVTVETYMGEEFSFNLKTTDEVVEDFLWRPPPVYHALSAWMREIGLGHKEPVLQDKIYNDRFEDEFMVNLCGSGGVMFVESLNGHDLAELIELIGLSDENESVFRAALFMRTGNLEHDPRAGETESVPSPTTAGSKKKKKKMGKKNGSSSPSSPRAPSPPKELSPKEQFELAMKEEEKARVKALNKAEKEAEAEAAAAAEALENAGKKEKKNEGKKASPKKASPQKAFKRGALQRRAESPAATADG